MYIEEDLQKNSNECLLIFNFTLKVYYFDIKKNIYGEQSDRDISSYVWKKIQDVGLNFNFQTQNNVSDKMD